MAQKRSERLQSLESAVKEYVGKEKQRIENEVASLEAILNGRTAGAGIQPISTTVVNAVALRDLSAYLKGG